MLKSDRILFFLLIIFIISCGTSEKNKDQKKVSISCIGNDRYTRVYKYLSDSIDTWSQNRLALYSDDKNNYEYQVDSLLCFNSDTSRLISCLLLRIKESPSDGLRFLYGERINNQWRFFSGASIVIPRRMAPNHNANTPLSYEELHKIALEEVYAPYLKENGEINEEWFIKHFEGPGWGFFDQQEKFDWFLKGKRFKTKKEFFEYSHMSQTLEMWANRDITKPIKRLGDKDTVLP